MTDPNLALVPTTLLAYLTFLGGIAVAVFSLVI